MPILCWTFVFAIFISSISLASDDAEQVFSKAKGYTVKIQTSTLIPFPGDSKGTSIGAGFVIDRSLGWIATNAHVAGTSPGAIEVSNFSKQKSQANRIYVDNYLDFAILQVDPQILEGEANLECERSEAIGIPVGAFGHPFDQPFTGTKGIVSGVRDDFDDLQGSYVQTDAPINPGNSGGPLIDLKSGKVIGMNTAGRGNAQNTNYALEVKQLCHITEVLKAKKDPRPVELPFAFFKDDDDRETLRVSQIHLPDGHEIQIDDVIEKANGISVKNEAQLINALRGRDENVTLIVNRKSKRLNLIIPFKKKTNLLEESGVMFSGILFVQERNPEALRILQTDSIITINHVEPGSIAESKRIASGNLIEEINGNKVATLKELFDIATAYKKIGKKIVLRMKALSFKKGHLFAFTERDIEVQDLKWIVKDTADTKSQIEIQHLADIK